MATRGKSLTYVLGPKSVKVPMDRWINCSKGGQPPVIKVVAQTLPRAWERMLLACWKRGTRIPTQYDQKGDPFSRDCIAIMVVTHPFREPRIHRSMPGGIIDLGKYVLEVGEGVHDHWIAPEEGKWQYTYHERLTAYSVPGLDQAIDQLEYVVKALCEAPHTRRAQAVLWKPWEDAGIHDPACLQRLWFRIFGDKLVLNINIRSNDAYKAAFMNMFAFTAVQKAVAEAVSQRLGREIRPGQYTHIADSFHIYGSYFGEFEERFLIPLQKRPWEGRVYRSDDPDIHQQLVEEAREEIEREKMG